MTTKKMRHVHNSYKLLVICFFLSIVGCATTMVPGLPGHIGVDRSKFDNSTVLRLEPAWIKTDFGRPYIKLGLYKTSRMQKEDIVLIAVVEGAHNFDKDKSLTFNIHGGIVSFKSIDAITDIETSSGHYSNIAYIPPKNWSSKQYLIDRSFLQTILMAGRVAIRIDLRKTYVEGILTGSQANKAFNRFNEKMESVFG